MSVGVEPARGYWTIFLRGDSLVWSPPGTTLLHQAVITECPLILCSSDFLKVSLLFFFISVYTHNTEKAMAPHSSTPAWKIPWTEEPGRLQSMGSPRVGHDWATSLSLFTFMHWRRKWQPTPVFLPGESQGRGSLVAAVYGVTQSQTWLKWLSIAHSQ